MSETLSGFASRARSERGWWVAAVGFVESDPAAVGVQDDLQVSFVNYDMMVNALVSEYADGGGIDDVNMMAFALVDKIRRSDFKGGVNWLVFARA